MAFESIIRPLEKSIGKDILPELVRAGKALFSPAIPEAASRGTAEAPAVLEAALSEPEAVAQRSKSIPFTGEPSLQEATRATEVSARTLDERVRGMKKVIGSFFHADPDLPKDLKKTLAEGRWRSEASGNEADLMLQKVYEPLTTDPPRKAALMYDYLVSADEVAQALRSGRTHINDQPLEKWQSQLSRLEPEVSGDPEITEAISRRRTLWDSIFNDMIQRGWTVPTHYLEDYTPIRKLHAIAEGLANIGGEELRSKFLPMMAHRTNAKGLRETNLVTLEKEVLGGYFKKVAEHEAFLNLIDDPTLNLTSQFKPGDIIPRKLAVYRPGAGMVGFMRKDKAGSLVAAMEDELKLPDNMVSPNGYVFPRPLVEALNSFHGPRVKNPVENALMKQGRSIAKWLTVYNPANTRLNMASDLGFAMFGGMPGEAAHPVGVFKWWNKVGVPASYKGAFGKGGTKVTINGQTVDVWELAQHEGLTEGTIHHDVGAGHRMSDELARLTPAGEREPTNPVLDVLQRDRLATEAAPRIAAGLDAWERTGDLKEFGRVGREITLTYGPNAPLASKLPVVKLISPFLQFVGLATQRVIDLMRAPESRNRAIAGIMAVPVATMMWNTQNEDYEKVENSLPEWERSQAHIILSDPKNPAQPRRDIEGKPVVLRFRYWVPEEVARAAGLGNLPSRVRRVVKGRETPMEFIQSVPNQAAQNISDLMTMPGLVQDVASGKTSTGREMKWPERALRLFPLAKAAGEGIAHGQDYGPVEGAKRFVEESAGLKFAQVGRKGSLLTDADLMDARQRVFKARAAWKTAIINGPPRKAEEAKKDFYAALKDVQRIVKVMGKEKEKANASPE